MHDIWKLSTQDAETTPDHIALVTQSKEFALLYRLPRRTSFGGKELLRFVEEVFESAHQTNIKDLIASICRTQKKTSITFMPPPSAPIDKILGPDWSGHALRCNPVFWHRSLKEKDITKLMAQSLSGNVLSIQAFLRAVCEACSVDGKIERFVPPRSAKVEVLAEYPTKCRNSDGSIAGDIASNGDGFIDILVRWQAEDGVRVVIFEVKFDAAAENPFMSYENEATAMIGSTCADRNNNVLLLFLIQHASSEREMIDRNHFENSSGYQWHVIYWQNFLPIWERCLRHEYTHAARPENSGSLRRSIFDKIYGGKQ